MSSIISRLPPVLALCGVPAQADTITYDDGGAFSGIDRE
jgi:hypothetical protein